MKFSTKGRYGLRALLDLTIHSKGEHIALCNIAQRQNLSTNYLEHVFSILRKSGLVNSIKGAQGGYILSKSPSEIKIGQILWVLEGPLSVVDENSELVKTDIQYCIKINVWDKINKSLNNLVYSITLEDLADSYRESQGIDKLMYYI